MKRDVARRNLYEAKLHTKKHLMHLHVAKELRTKLGQKSRSMLVNKGDTVKIMRGSFKGKSVKVAKVNYNNMKLYLEGVTRKNAKGTEVLIAFEASNLMLTDLNMTQDRKKTFGTAPKAAEPKV